MSETTGILIIMAIMTVLGLIIAFGSRVDPPSTDDLEPGPVPGLQLGEADVVRGVGDPSALSPWGWCLIALGLAAAGWAWLFMDITPAGYSDTVNIDAVSQRAMLHTAGLVTATIGAVMACAGHVVNEVRRGR